jgi:hypothetical protein
MEGIQYTGEGKSTTLVRLKDVFGPDGVISPGRYAIG